MNKGVNLHKFYFEKSTDVGEICRPLFEAANLQYYCFIVIDNSDNSRYLLTNKPKWLHYFYQNELYNNAIIQRAEYQNQFSSYLWSDYIDQQPFRDGLQFNINAGISLINSNPQYTNIYCFGTNNQRSNEFFLSHMEYFNHFVTYFHDAGEKLIKMAQKYQFHLPSTSLAQQYFMLRNQQLKQEVFTRLEPKRIVIDNSGTYFTRQEALCVYLTLSGDSAKSIARTLNLSYRTVEKHLLNAKNKMNCQSITSLLSCILQSSFLKQLILFGDRQLAMIHNF